ncbi:putative necrosis-inducing factor-domain-containing protein, partial [Panaeolus papilionaceus]
LVAVSSAVPNPAPEAGAAIDLAARGVGTCDDSTFINQSSGGSPRVDDCLQITRNVDPNRVYTLPIDSYFEIESFGTCAIGGFSAFVRPMSNVKIGGQDVIDIITDSVRRFQWNGLVGAKGDMRCQMNPDLYHWSQRVDWGIYH